MQNFRLFSKNCPLKLVLFLLSCCLCISWAERQIDYHSCLFLTVKCESKWTRQKLSVPVSTNSCSTACHAAFAMFTGNNLNTNCFCSYAGNYDCEEVAESRCNLKCKYDNPGGQMCGGYVDDPGSYLSYMSVRYAFFEFGCFKLIKVPDSMMLIDPQVPRISLEICSYSCMKEQKCPGAGNPVCRYAGVWNGDKCYCSALKEHFAKLGKGECTKKCSAGRSMCGGPEAISTAVATHVDDCSYGDYCQNGGTCTDKPGDYKCVCPKGYTGENCEKPPGRSSTTTTSKQVTTTGHSPGDASDIRKRREKLCEIIIFLSFSFLVLTMFLGVGILTLLMRISKMDQN